MIRETKSQNRKTRTGKRLLMGLLAICLTSGLTACRATKVIDPNTATVRMTKGQPFTPVCDGYFLPDSVMLRVLDRLSEKDVFGK